MNLFLNAISKEWVIILFNDSRHIVDKQRLHILWNESSKLSDILDKFIIKNNINYGDLKNILAVNWPGSFTWVRVISLVINTIAFVYKKINITEISFFDLFDKYPIIKSSSKRDLFVKYSSLTKIEIVKNEDFVFKNKKRQVYWDLNNNLLSEKIDLVEEINYNTIIQTIKFDKKKIIKPLYIKKPSIS